MPRRERAAYYAGDGRAFGFAVGAMQVAGQTPEAWGWDITKESEIDFEDVGALLTDAAFEKMAQDPEIAEFLRGIDPDLLARIDVDSCAASVDTDDEVDRLMEDVVDLTLEDLAEDPTDVVDLTDEETA